MIKHLPKVFTVQDREHHTQLAISAQRGWSAAMAYIFPLFFFFFSFTEVLAQCTPTVSIDRASMMFCEDENTAFDLSVDVSPSKAVFTGSGVMDPDSSDNVATFNPFLAGPGSHRITYVVTSNDGGCISGNRDSITVVVNEIPDAGGDGVAFVCQEMGTGINLFPALVDPMSGGFWSSVRGIMPSGSIGALTDAQIASLGAGVDTFVYTIMGMPPCADSMAQVILTITDVPNTPSSVTVDPICEGDMATVTIEGLEDANYEISYNINGATPLVDTLASTTMTGSFNTDALSTGGMLNILGIRNIDVNPSCDTSVFIARTLTVNPSPHLQGRDTVICDQASFDLRLLVDSIASGDGTEYGTTYGNYNLGSNSIISPLIVGTTTYYVRDSVAATQCVDTTLIRLTVLANPSIVGRDSTICEGSSIDLRLLITGDSVNTLEYGTGSGTGAGYGVYTFSSGSITPMAGVTTYYVRDSSPVAGCVDTAAIVITTTPQPQLRGRDTIICDGMNFDLRLLVDSLVSGDGTEYGPAYGNYSFGSNSIITPMVGIDTFYVRDSVAMTQCVDTTFVVVEVLRTPFITGRDTSICAGESIDLRLLITGDSVNTLEYGTGSGTGAGYGVYTFSSGTITPMAGVTTYYVRDSSPVAGCVDTAAIVITATPQPELLGRDTVICAGMNFDLRLLVDSIVSGDGTEYGDTYGNYNRGGNSIITPMVGIDTFYVRDSVAMTQCVDTTFVVVEVLPTPFIIGRDTSICAGESIDLRLLITGDSVNTLEYGTGSGTGAGYGVYTFSSGTITPMAGMTTYYVRDSSTVAGCVDTAEINVLARPVPMIVGRDTAICSGQDVDLSTLITRTNAGDSLEFGTIFGVYGPQSDSFQMGLTATTTFFVRDSVGFPSCSDTAMIRVTVIDQPLITGSYNSVCPNTEIDLNTLIVGTPTNTLEYGNSYGTYGASNLQVVTANTTFFVRDSSTIAGCVDTARIVVNVYTPPIAGTIIGTTELCVDAIDTLQPTPTSGTTPYTDTLWMSDNPSVVTIDGIGQIKGISNGSANIQYVIIDANGCRDTSSNHTVNVFARPMAGNIVGDTALCIGSTITVNANATLGSPPYTLNWSSVYDTIATIDPLGNVTGINAGTTNLQYIVSDDKGCRDTSPVQLITVDPFPVIGWAISDADTTICQGDEVTFTATGGVSYEFLVNNVTAQATGAANTYQTNSLNDGDQVSAVVTTTAGCQDTSDIIIINVNPIPTASLMSDDADNVIATGQTVTFTATGGVEYAFNINGTLVRDTLASNTFTTSTLNNQDTVIVEVFDGNACTDSASLIITVNAPPIAVNDTLVIMEDALATDILVQANDADPENDPLTTSIVVAPDNGNAIVFSGDTISYFPDANFNGQDSIVYQVCDTEMNCDSATVYITVLPVNDMPVAENDTLRIMEDDGLQIVDVQGNDVDVDDDVLVTSLLTVPTKGTASVMMDSTVAYTPSPDSSGIDVVAYQVCDTSGSCGVAIVYIEITPVNDTPMTNSDFVIVLEDTMNVPIPVTINDTDIDIGDSLFVSIIGLPTSGGMASILDDTMVIYSPAANFVGMDTLIYQVCDTSIACAQDTVFITVNPVNDHPIAVNDFVTVNEDTSNVIVDVQVNDMDVDGDLLKTRVISSTMVVDTLNGDSIIATPPANFSGVQLIGYEICDPMGLCDTAIVTITVLPVNDPPVANTDFVSITQDTTNVKILPLANDVDVDDVTLVLNGTPTAINGTVSIIAPDTLNYTPTGGFSGIDTINYTVCDTSMLCDNGLVIVTVGFVNTPPLAVNDTVPAIMEDGGSVTHNVIRNDSDVDGLADTLKVTAVGTPTNGMAVVSGDSSITYTPALNFNGMDSVQYTVCDTSMGCAMAWVFFDVTPVNDSPIAVNDTAYLTRDTMNALIAVEVNDFDIDGDVTSVSTLGNSTAGVVPTVQNDSILYTAITGFVGVDTIRYELSDGTLKDTAMLLIVITDPNNIRPIANRDSVSTVPGIMVQIDVQGNDVDGNGDPLTTSIVTPPNAMNSATVLNGDSIIYTTSINFAGFDTLFYQVCDVSLACDTAMVVISVVNTLQVSARVFLEGPYDAAQALMHDSLRKLSLLPATEPYSSIPNLPGAYQFVHKGYGGGETIANPTAVFGVTGPDAIVDWVYLELLSDTDTIPIASRAALLQRDGDIVDIDGVSTVGFEYLPSKAYFLSIRHRNHLGVMTKTARPFTTGSTIPHDFTVQGASGQDAFGTHAMDTIQTRLVLWAGDGNADRKVIYDGIANDRDPVFFDVFNDPANVNSNYNHVARGYLRGDYDMKGSSIYIGSGNDTDIIFFNVFLYPNTLGTLTIIQEQIPR